MRVPFDAAEAEDFLGDEDLGLFINVAEVHPKQWFYTLTKVVLGTPVIETADEGPYISYEEAMHHACNIAEKHLNL